MILLLGVCFALLTFAATPAAQATTVKDVVRVNGQGESILRGVGLVIGLNKTGDSGKELAVARPLTALLENSGNKLGTPEEIKNSKSVALVVVQCVIPASGARADDRVDITVSVVNSASSLEGGTLYLAPMRGPFKNSDVYAIAQGPITIDDPKVPTTARVRGGARLIKDILMPPVEDVFDLIIEPPFSGWPAAGAIAGGINAQQLAGAAGAAGSAIRPAVARVVDERTVRVTIPEDDRGEPSAFLAEVFSAPVDLSNDTLPAQVIVNPSSGSIIVTGDVEISPVAITHKDLTITTLIGGPPPNTQPRVDKSRWAKVTTQQNAKLDDLLQALKQLDVPPKDQVSILQMLHKTGKLQAKLIVD